MKLLFLLACMAFSGLQAQTVSKNLIIITTDGLRWQELFGGMDSAIANNPAYHQEDSAYIYREYWAEDGAQRRKKLFPFFWNTIVAQGQLAGNRNEGSLVNNYNPYWFSYPGYSEIMTGYADTAINRNDYPPNPHMNVLEYLHRHPAFRGKVAAFGAWNAFDRILNEERSRYPVINAFDTLGGKQPTATEKLLNRMLHDSFKPWLDAECLDLFTHYGAMEYLKNKRPRVLYIAYGETDEWAHSGMYRNYLDAARQVDQWIEEIWNWVQKDPQYRNNTTIFITTDHGRGDVVKSEWTSHNSRIEGANEIWYAALGPGIRQGGMLKNHPVIYQRQFAQTFAKILGQQFRARHPVAPYIPGLLK
jgi:hypothetical protein